VPGRGFHTMTDGAPFSDLCVELGRLATAQQVMGTLILLVTHAT